MDTASSAMNVINPITHGTTKDEFSWNKKKNKITNKLNIRI